MQLLSSNFAFSYFKLKNIHCSLSLVEMIRLLEEHFIQAIIEKVCLKKYLEVMKQRKYYFLLSSISKQGHHYTCQRTCPTIIKTPGPNLFLKTDLT